MEKKETAFPTFSIDHLHSRIFSDDGETRDILGSPIEQTQQFGAKRPAETELSSEDDVEEEDDDDDDDSVVDIFDNNGDSKSAAALGNKRPRKGVLSPVVNTVQILAEDSMPLGCTQKSQKPAENVWGFKFETNEGVIGGPTFVSTEYDDSKPDFQSEIIDYVSQLIRISMSRGVTKMTFSLDKNLSTETKTT